MFQAGFEKEIFSQRHPDLGVSFNDIQTWWKSALPGLKQDVKPLTTQPLPGTTPVVPRVTQPAPSSGGSTLLLVGGLAVVGLGSYWLLAKKPFGISKRK